MSGGHGFFTKSSLTLLLTNLRSRCAHPFFIETTRVVKFDGKSARPALAQLSPQHMPLVSPVMPDNITQQRRDKIFDITYERKQLWRSHNFAEELERERLALIKKAQLKYSSGGIGHVSRLVGSLAGAARLGRDIGMWSTKGDAS